MSALDVAPAGTARAELTGRVFVHPVFDYLLIGGGLSLLFTPVVIGLPALREGLSPGLIWTIVLLSNMAHFASSTVRLYTKPGATERWPFLTMSLPLLLLGIVVLCMQWPLSLGIHLQKLYFTWSPYHYAAQAFGLASIYCARSGCRLDASHKSMLRWAAMLPFLSVFLTGNEAGLQWLAPGTWIASIPGPWLQGLRVLLAVLSFGLPAVLFVRFWRSRDGSMPLIAPLFLFSNAIWWFVFPVHQAFVWAAIFHGIQYLGIVIIFHVKDQMARPDNAHGVLFHVLSFYGVSVLLGYALFRVLPWGFVSLGYGMVESALLVVAAINVHHFVVDAYIWRSRAAPATQPAGPALSPVAG